MAAATRSNSSKSRSSSKRQQQQQAQQQLQQWIHGHTVNIAATTTATTTTDTVAMAVVTKDILFLTDHPTATRQHLSVHTAHGGPELLRPWQIALQPCCPQNLLVDFIDLKYFTEFMHLMDIMQGSCAQRKILSQGTTMGTLRRWRKLLSIFSAHAAPSASTMSATLRI